MTDLPHRLRALLRSIPNIRETRMRRMAMRRHLATWRAEELAVVLERLVPLAAARRWAAQQTAQALGLAIVAARHRDDDDTIEAARRVAGEHGLRLAAAVLARPEDPNALPRHGRLREICIPARRAFVAEHGTEPTPRTVSYFGPDALSPWFAEQDREGLANMSAEDLLHWATSIRKKAHRTAALSIPALRRLQPRNGLPIEQCVLHPDPVFIRRLLRQPWIEERDVLRIASRRPTRAAVAVELTQSDRWIVKEAVRYALMTNPFTPPDVVLPLLPGASSRTLTTLASSATGAPAVAAVARTLLRLMRDEAPAHA